MTGPLIDMLAEQHGLFPHFSYQLHADNLEALTKEQPQLGKAPSCATVRRAMKARGWYRRKTAHANQTEGRRKLNNAEKVFKQFYKEKAEKKILERLKRIEEKFHQKPNSIKVLELHNRWASWTPKHGLNFHWKCAMAPVPVLDYIIIHEMVHLKYPNHSPEFWNELDKKMPNYKEHENWLKYNGVKMTI
jgi:predicted metal-dependent hydrolase